MYSQWGAAREDSTRHLFEVLKTVDHMVIRSEPCHNSVPTGRIASSGDRLKVAEMVRAAGARDDGGDQTFLRLSEGGYAFVYNRMTGAPLVKEIALPKTPTYTEISKFSFAHDDRKKRVSVYVDLPGVHRIPAENIVAEFGPRNFDVRISSLGDANYRLRVPETYDTLEPAECSLRVKTDRIVVSLKTGTPVVPFSTWSRLATG